MWAALYSRDGGNHYFSNMMLNDFSWRSASNITHVEMPHTLQSTTQCDPESLLYFELTECAHHMIIITLDSS